MLPEPPPPDLPQAIRALLLAARAATQGKMGVSFHVGSQCMRPTAYQAAMAQAAAPRAAPGAAAGLGSTPELLAALTAVALYPRLACVADAH